MPPAEVQWCDCTLSFSQRCGGTSLVSEIDGFMRCEWIGRGCSPWRSRGYKLQRGIDAESAPCGGSVEARTVSFSGAAAELLYDPK